MKYIIAVMLVLIVCVHFACESRDQNKLFDEKEEAAVYRSFIDNYYLNWSFSKHQFRERQLKVLVVNNQTSGFMIPFSYQEDIAKLSSKPDDETVKNFLDRNDGYYPKARLTEQTLKVIGRYPINPYIRFAIPHILISDAERDQILGNGGWSEFFQRYPYSWGIVYFSRVGFNENKTQALLYFVHSNENEEGGVLAFLKKKKSEWKQIAQIYVYMS
jgi:hypothetical protein